MKGFNKVIVAGNLTRDPELKYTPRGTAVARIGLAVNRSWRDENGEQKEETTFVDVDAFGKQAETIGQYLKKGRPLLVEGRLKQDSWEDKNTKEKRYRLYVVMETFTFLDSGNTQEGGQRSTAPASRFDSNEQMGLKKQSAPSNQSADDSEVPF